MAFDDLTDVYEAMIDWPKRLANEGPFYRELFQRAGVRRVVDVACGTGRHAAMFHSWGLEVEGADVSPKMLDRARAQFGQPEGLRWVLRGFEEPINPALPLDAAVCVGNSLALARDMAAVEQAVRQMLAAVRPGGVVVLQVLNLWHLPDGPCVWQKSRRAALPQGEVLILKGVHRCGRQGYVDLVLTDPNSGQRLHSESVPFLGLEAAELDDVLRRGGAAQVSQLGGYRQQTYDRQTSIDLIVVAGTQGPMDGGSLAKKSRGPRVV